MSQENVEVVRALVEAWDVGEMDAYRELHDPDLGMEVAAGWPERGPSSVATP